MAIFASMEQLVGATPLLALNRLKEELRYNANVLVKLESYNPGGSAKDRVALSMLNAAEADGRLSPGGTVIEPTSGNTGIGLAAVAACRGYKTIIVMPDSMSIERQLLMKAYGAQVVLTPGKDGISGSIAKAEELAKQIPGSFIPDQFNNPANSLAHYHSTGPEIWADTQGAVDILVAGVGTGGTLTGTGRYLKEQKPSVQVVAVEPADSPLLSQGVAGSHGIQGIGANFVPSVLDRRLIDRICTATQQEAYHAARLLAAKEGILCGISSGAALHAALALAAQKENTGKTIVAVLPDTGERYLSSDLFR